MVSGVSQGASVIARASGMVLGVATFSWRHRLSALDLNRVGRPVVLALLVPYASRWPMSAGWFRAQKLGVAAGMARLDDVDLAAFLLPVLRAVPIDDVQHDRPRRVVCARRRRRAGSGPDIAIAFRSGARRCSPSCVASVAETSKVFLTGRLPDYTDVFIAGCFGDPGPCGLASCLRAAARAAEALVADAGHSDPIPAPARGRATTGAMPPSTSRTRAPAPALEACCCCAVAVFSVERRLSGRVVAARDWAGRLCRVAAALPDDHLSDCDPAVASGVRSRPAQRPILLGRARRSSRR